MMKAGITFTLLLTGLIFNMEVTAQSIQIVEREVESWFNDELKSEKFTIDGKMDSTYTEWYTNGRKKSLYYYTKGKKDGVFKEWRVDGSLKKEGMYELGKKKGEWTFYNANGEIKKTKTYGPEPEAPEPVNAPTENISEGP